MPKFEKEADVKAAVKKILKAHEPRVWWYMPVQTGYGVRGIPDFVVCVDGAFLGIETKFGNNSLSKWQEIQVNGIHTAGGQVLLINETNLDVLESTLATQLVGKG